MRLENIADFGHCLEFAAYALRTLRVSDLRLRLKNSADLCDLPSGSGATLEINQVI